MRVISRYGLMTENRQLREVNCKHSIYHVMNALNIEHWTTNNAIDNRDDAYRVRKGQATEVQIDILFVNYWTVCVLYCVCHLCHPVCVICVCFIYAHSDEHNAFNQGNAIDSLRARAKTNKNGIEIKAYGAMHGLVSSGCIGGWRLICCGTFVCCSFRNGFATVEWGKVK